MHYGENGTPGRRLQTHYIAAYIIIPLYNNHDIFPTRSSLYPLDGFNPDIVIVIPAVGFVTAIGWRLL